MQVPAIRQALKTLTIKNFPNHSSALTVVNLSLEFGQSLADIRLVLLKYEAQNSNLTEKGPS